MRNVLHLLLALMTAVSMSACDKGGDSNGAAATPVEAEEDTTETSSINCYWSWSHKAYVDSSGKTCTPSSADIYSNSYCHYYIYDKTAKKWIDTQGNTVTCTPGYIDFRYFQPYYVISQQGYSASCSYYGYGWYPMQFGYSYVCVQSSYINNFYPNFNTYYGYGSGYGYYGSGGYGYASYPRSCRWGVDCQRCQGLSAGGNLGTLWFGGTLGLCL